MSERLGIGLDWLAVRVPTNLGKCCGWRRLCKAAEKLLWGRHMVDVIGRDGMGWDGDQEPAVAALVPSLGHVYCFLLISLLSLDVLKEVDERGSSHRCLQVAQSSTAQHSTAQHSITGGAGGL